MPSAARVASRVGWRIATWLPFTIVCSLIVFCWGVLSFSLALQHNMIHLSRWWKGMAELVLTQFLAGMTLWSFLAAIFTNPGTSTNNGPVEPEIDDRDFEELGASRRISKSGSRSSRPTSTVENDPEWDEQEVSAPLLPNSGPAGISRLLPGQPQLPARTGRQQFDDLMNGAAASATALEEPVQNGRRRAANLMVKSSGDARWCGKCDAAKPDRAHHCSTCGICVLRMDHHCPWLASSCVGLRNHKPFFLFLFYTSAFCVYGFQETARALVAFVNDEPDGFENSPIAWAAVLFTGFIFGLALVPFTAYHAYLICRNRTTIESLEGSGRIRIRSELEAGGKAAERPRIKHRLRDLMRRSVDASQATMRVDPEEDGDVQWKTDEALTREERQALKRAGKVNVYDLGVSENWRQIMGTQPLFWFVPIGYPDSDGFSYMIDVAKLEKIQRITDAVRGVRYPAQGQHTRPRTYAEDQSQQSFTLFNADEEPDEHR